MATVYPPHHTDTPSVYRYVEVERTKRGFRLRPLLPVVRDEAQPYHDPERWEPVEAWPYDPSRPVWEFDRRWVERLTLESWDRAREGYH